MEYMLLLTSLCLTLFAWRSKFFHKSALYLFNLYWFTILFLYSFRFYGLYSIREDTFKMYFYGIVSFFIGYVLFNIFWKIEQRETIIDNYGPLKNRLLSILVDVSIIIYLQKSILALPLWLAGGMGEVKTTSIVDSSLDIGAIGNILFVYVAKPIHATIMIFAIVAIFQGVKNRWLYIKTAILLVLGFIGTASRFSITEILIPAIAYVYMFTNMNIKQFAGRYPMLFSTSVSVIIVVLIFMAFSGDVFEGVYCYLCGCIPCSDNALLRIDESFNYYGIVSFNGVLRVINQVPSMFGFLGGVRDVLDVAYEYMLRFEETTYISPYIRYNAFVSMFTYFYADAGYTGVWVLSLLFGGFTAIINMQAFKNPTFNSCSLLLFVVIMIFNSVVRVQTFLVPSVMSIIYIYILIPKESILINTQTNSDDSIDDRNDQNIVLHEVSE